MIGQYLPQTNESATVPKTFQFSDLNKASVDVGRWAGSWRLRAISPGDHPQMRAGYESGGAQLCVTKAHVGATARLIYS